MKKRLEAVEKDVHDIKTDVKSLERKFDQLFQLLSDKFDIDFSSIQNPQEKENDSGMISIKDQGIQTLMEKLEQNQYSNPNSNISIATSSHSLYDLADDLDEENVLIIAENEITPPTSANTSLNTPKKKLTSLAQTGQSIKSKTSPINLNLVVVNVEEQKTPEKKKRTRTKRNNASQSTSSSPSTNKSPQLVQCELCGKFINGIAAMKRHTQTHTNNRPHACPECGKAFQRKFHLKTHRMIHLGDKKHMCRFCGKLFLLPKDIVAHERVHTGEKPYACSDCPRRFTLKSHLVMHIRTHTGEKPYKCEYQNCQKLFSQANSLRVHKKTHLSRPVETVVESTVEENVTFSIPSTNSNSMEPDNNVNVIGRLIPITLQNDLIMPSSSGLSFPIQLPIALQQISIQESNMQFSDNSS